MSFFAANQTIEYRGGDSSWKNEWLEFTKAVTTRKEPLGNGEDGYRAIQIVNAVYKASKTGRTIDLT
jgi:predicted dehydrogenase